MTEERKLVTVLFADIVGSTALGSSHDPEVVRRTLSRAFGEVRQVLETHGGTVEKFIGDAVMAVFGIPQTHDDDADRAVRAAFALRDRIAARNADGRFALEHPSLFSIGVQRNLPSPEIWERFQSAASSARGALEARLARLMDENLLGGRTVSGALFEFHGICEGLAALELRGGCPPGLAEQWWREGLSALVAGFALPVRPGRGPVGAGLRPAAAAPKMSGPAAPPMVVSIRVKPSSSRTR